MKPRQADRREGPADSPAVGGRWHDHGVHTDRMGASAARRAALAAQGLAGPGRTVEAEGPAPDRGVLRRAVRRLGLLQLDSVNVAVRAHYAPLQARLGAYDRDLLDALAWSDSARSPRTLVEYWAHEASLVPVEDWPLLRWRMRDNAARTGGRLAGALERSPGILEAVYDAVAEHGPLDAAGVEATLGGPGPARAAGGWWNRTDSKIACEHLFAAGALTTATRRGFRRVYDLTERVLPAPVLAADPDRSDAVRELVRRSAAALGVATEPDLLDYYRLPPAEGRAAITELVDAGELVPTDVDGWEAPAYRGPDARVPRRVLGSALLAPFDPLVWFRPRAERIFGFTYRIGIYTPAHLREHGYYVFPFLLDGELVARADLKADRAAGVLRVPGAFAEPGADTASVAPAMARTLHGFAAWLGLDTVAAEGGPLAAPLAAALSHESR